MNKQFLFCFTFLLRGFSFELIKVGYGKIWILIHSTVLTCSLTRVHWYFVSEMLFMDIHSSISQPVICMACQKYI